MADLYYYEQGYIDAKYHVYVADAEIALGPYIDKGYIEANYYDDYSSVASLTCELTLRPGETVSATGAWTSQFTQTALVGRLQSVSANFTSAFAPTLTVDAFKNHTAILESTSTFTVDAVANRSANVLLEHIANLNAQAAKTAVVDSTMATQATLSSAPVKSVTNSATLNTTTTVSCLAFNVTFFDAQLSFGSALTTSRFLGTGRPHITNSVNGSAYYDASDKQEGTHSIVLSGTGLIYDSEPSDAFTINANENFDINFYLKIDHIPTNERTVASYGGDDYAWRIVANSAGVASLRFFFRNAAGTVLSLNAVDISTRIGQWMFVRAFRTGTSLGFTVNGLGVGTTTSAIAYRQPATFADRKISIFGVDNTTGGGTKLTKFDIFTYTIANTEIIKLPFNNNTLDDTAITQEGAAALTSTASVTTIGTNVKGAASAGLTSTASLTISVGKLQPAAATLVSTVTQSASAVKTVQALVDITANATVSATAYRIKQFVSNQNALFTPTVTVQAQLAGVALLESQFAQSTSAVKTARTTTSISAVATVSSSVTVTAGFAGAFNTAATTSILGYRTRFANSDLNTSTTLTCDFVAFNRVSADLVSAVTVTADVTKFKRVQASLSAEFTQTTSAVKTTDAISTTSSESTLTADNVRIRFADSQQSAEFTQTTQAVKTSRYQIDITVTTTQTTAVNFIAENIIPVGSLFEPSINADAQFAGFALLESTSTVTAVIGSIKQFDQETTYYNSGVSSYELEDYPYNKYPRLLMSFDRGAFDTLRPRENGFTLSIWVKRDQIEYNQFQAMVSNQQPNPTGPTAAFTFRGTDVWLRQNYDPDEPNPVWTNVSTDTDWHHYLFYTTAKDEQFGEYFRLWVDGVYQGERQYGAADESVAFNSGEFLLLGYSSLAEITGGYLIEPAGNDAGFAQIWMGVIPSSLGQNWMPPVDYFYDHGYVELYDDGRGQDDRLPQPLVYNRLDEPWTGVDFYPNYHPQYTGDERPASQPLTDPWHSYFRLHCNYVGVFLFRADLTAQAVMQTTVIAQRRAQADLTSSITINIDADQRIGIVAAITATVTQTASVIRIQSAIANVTSTTNIVCAPGFIKLFDADLTAISTLDCDFAVKPPIRTEANLLAQFTVTADPASFTDSITMMMSSGTLVADATLIPPIRVEADLITTSTLTVTIGSIEQFAVLVAASGTMITTAVKTTGILETLSTVSTVSATIKHYKGIILTVTAFNTQLTVGEVINLDPYLTLKINSETRGLLILKETRDITIESETRVNII